MTLNRKIIDTKAFEESEKAFNHAERTGLTLGPRRYVKAAIRCNQLTWSGQLCEWTTTIEYRAVEIENRIRNVLIHHLRQAHRNLDAVATADRRFVTLRDIGG